MLDFNVQIGTDYSGEWTSSSTLRVTSLATHPNFLGYDVDPAVALSKARCRWGDNPGDETIPEVLEEMTVVCSSYLHASPGERKLLLSLNEEDYTELTPLYGYYDDPRIAVFSQSLEPEG